MISYQKPKEIYIDNESEVDNLPIYPELSIGSVAILATDSTVYMLGKDGWNEI